MFDRSLLPAACLEFVVVSDTHYMLDTRGRTVEFESRRRQTARVERALCLIASLNASFVVHLGDYIYETTGDPSFQTPDESRKILFRNLSAAIQLQANSGAIFHAARSLDNYRDLYRTYRSDPALRALHESFPMIVTWDDHEFSNDCWGSHATYLNGREDENDVERRKAANQAWFEYQPVDFAEMAPLLRARQ